MIDLVDRLRLYIRFEHPKDYENHIVWKAADKITELSEALDLLVAYWDEWKDAPDNHPTTLSLEEVVDSARDTLNRRKK